MSVMEQQEPVRSRRSFTDEFKRDAVALVVDEGRRVIDVARSLGVGEGTLGNCVRQARVDRGERAGLTTSEKAELAELRKENARLRMERDLLKRATAFWAKESGQ
jgi:transposase